MNNIFQSDELFVFKFIQTDIILFKNVLCIVFYFFAVKCFILKRELAFRSFFRKKKNKLFTRHIINLDGFLTQFSLKCHSIKIFHYIFFYCKLYIKSDNFKTFLHRNFLFVPVIQRVVDYCTFCDEVFWMPLPNVLNL